MGKDNSSLTKEIVNFIFKDKEFPNLSDKQILVLNSSLPKELFDLNRADSLIRNSAFLLKDGQKIRINYNPKQNYAAWNGSQVQFKGLAKQFGFSPDTNLSSKDNFIKMLKEIGLEEFFSRSLSKIAEDKEWLIINKNISAISSLDYSMLNFDFIKLESDIFMNSNDKDTFFVKHNDKNIFQIQVPAAKNRPNSIILRINLDNIGDYVRKVVLTNETWGISVEVAICQLFSIPIPKEYANRYDSKMVLEAQNILGKALESNVIPIFTECLATKTVGYKKSPTDFKAGKLRVSVKSNFNGGSKVCPPDFGQPGVSEGIELYNRFFIRKLDEKTLFENDMVSFKTQFIENIVPIVNEQLKMLFSEDAILYMRKTKAGRISMEFIDTTKNDFTFESGRFTFTQNAKGWNDSTTIKYDGISLAEMQLHKSRSPFKFRFNMPNLYKLIKKVQGN